MWNLAPLIPEQRRFTRVYRGRPELIDHIFVSHLPRCAGTRTARHHGRSSTRDCPQSRTTQTRASGKPGSDHAADAGV